MNSRTEQAPGLLLETLGLTKTFAGVSALEDVDFALRRGELRAIIGPNGAGKTTLANLVCGRFAPTRGHILFMGNDITNLSPDRRAKLGIGYMFQRSSIFPRLTTFDNVRLAVQARLLRWLNPLGPSSVAEVDQKAVQVLEAVGLKTHATTVAANLSHGDQRRLELGITLGLQPQLLLLDEPTQGMGAAEVAAIVELIRGVSNTATVLLIEHNMDVVFQLAHRVTVLDRGRILAEGGPDEISEDSRVQEAYIGRRR